MQILESELNTKCNITIQARITQNLVFFCLDSDNSVKTDEVFGFIVLFAKQLQLRYKVEEYHAKILSRDNLFYFIKAGVIMKPSF